MYKLISLGILVVLFSVSQNVASPARRQHSSGRNSVSSEISADSVTQGFIQASQVIGALIKAFGLGIRLNMMAYAVGFHFIIDRITESEKRERYVIAKTAMKMWHQLRTIQTVDDIFLNVTINLVQGNMDRKNFLNETLMYQFLEQEFHQNPRTNLEYRQLKSKIAELPMVSADVDGCRTEKMDLSGPDRLERLLEFSFAKRCMLNWYFAISSREHEAIRTNETFREHYLLARSMLRLAEQTDLRDALQQIYDASLNEASEVVVNLTGDFEKGHQYLFEKIEEKMRAAPDLYQKLQEVSQSLRIRKVLLYLPDSEFTLLPPIR